MEARYSSVIYYNLMTQKGNEIQKNYREGISVRVIDKKRLKFAYSDRGIIDSAIHSAEWSPLSTFTPPVPLHYHEKKPEPIGLPVESVENALETFNGLAEARVESLTFYEHIYTNMGTEVSHGNSKLLVRIFFTPQKGFTVVYSFAYPGEDVIKKLEQLESPDHQFSAAHSGASGQYDVVLSPQVTGMIFHEIAHSFEGSIPRMTFPPSISLSDNPGAERLGGYTYDSEGCKTSHTILVTNGIVCGCLTSTIMPGDRTPTGNARASSFDVQPIPRQSNLEIDTNVEKYKEEELLEMINHGVYIAQIGQGSIFPENITYFANTVSYRIEKGEIGEPLLNVHFGGKLVDTVNSIQYIGANHEVVPAVCWKKNQRLFITTKAPSSLVRGMPLSCYDSSKS